MDSLIKECILQNCIKFSLYSLYYVEKCNEFARPIFSKSCLHATQLPLKKFCSSGLPFPTLRPIRPAQDLKPKPTAP